MRLKAKETALLLVPFLILAGAAWWLGRKPPKPTDNRPFRLVVQSVKREKPTPRDVAEGFDSRLIVMVGHRGQRPETWGNARHTAHGINSPTKCSLRSTRNSIAVNEQFHSSVRNSYFVSQNSAYRVPIVFNSRSAPTSFKRLILTFLLGTPDWFQHQLRNTPWSNFVSFEVLHQIPKSLPHASKYCPLRVRSVHQQYSPKSGGGRVCIISAIIDSVEPIKPAETNEMPLSNVGAPFLEDERGKHYSIVQSLGNSISPLKDSYSFQSMIYSPLPQNARKLTFKTRVSLDENWPLPISIVLWDKTKPASSKISNKPVAQR